MYEIAFVSNYKDLNWKDRISYKFTEDCKDHDAAVVIGNLAKLVIGRSTEFLEHKDKVDTFVKSTVKGKGMSAVVNAIKMIKPKDLTGMCDKETKKLYENYLLYKVFDVAGVPLLITGKESKSGKVTDAFDFEGVMFYAKYKKWVVVKRMAKYEHTQDPEFIGILASINDALFDKMFVYSELDYIKLDEEVKGHVKGLKRNYSNLSMALSKIGSRSDDEIAYLGYHIMKSLKYSPYSSVEHVIKVYPEMKKILKKRKKKKRK